MPVICIEQTKANRLLVPALWPAAKPIRYPGIHTAVGVNNHAFPALPPAVGAAVLKPVS